MNAYRYIWVEDQLKKCILSAYDEMFLNERWQFAPSPKEADAFLYTEYTLSTLNILEVCGVKPLIVFQPRDTIPEFSLESLNHNALCAILNKIDPLVDKLSELGDLIRDTYHNLFYAGLVFLWSRGASLDPVLDTHLSKGYGYLYFDTVIQEMNPKIGILGKDIFDYLEGAALVESLPFEVAHACPKCEGILLLLRDGCVSCGSVHINENTIVHHFSCGFQAAEEKFKAINQELLNEYFCPKCRKPLRHFGIDYDKSGVIYVCDKCSHENYDTDVFCKCVACGYEGNSNTIDRLKIFSYGLTPMGEKSVFNASISIFNVKDYLKHHLSLVEFHLFLLLLKKMISLRSPPKSQVLIICIDDKIVISEAQKIIVEIGKDLTKFIRKSDVISFYAGNLYLFFPECDAAFVDKIIKTKMNDLATIFDDQILSHVSFVNTEAINFIKNLEEM